jgi:hypothetical protein
LQAPLLAVDEGNLPLWTYGIGIAIGIRASHAEVTVGGVLWLPQSSTSAGSYGATYARRSGELAGCYAWQRGSFEAGPCGSLTLEDVTAAGIGPFVTGAPGHATWLTVGVAARGQWWLRRWVALFLRPSLTFTTSRPTFAIESVGPVYRVPPAAVGVQIGCEWMF